MKRGLLYMGMKIIWVWPNLDGENLENKKARKNTSNFTLKPS